MEVDEEIVNAPSALTWATLGPILLFVGIGGLTGVLHFMLLRWNVHLFLTSGALWRAVCLQLLRMILTSAALIACALAGALQLLAAMGGLVLARRIMRPGESKP